MNEVQARSEAAAVLGRSKSKAKAEAARENGKLGGRPKGNAHDRRKQNRRAARKKLNLPERSTQKGIKL
jgi:hypothetical protein